MSGEPKIVSLTPAITGWWAKFKDDDRTEWYSPVAAWALCNVQDDTSRMTGGTHQLILPVLTSEAGMTPYHDEQGYYELLYLPDEKFTPSVEPGCSAWYPVKDAEGGKSEG